MIYTYKIVPIKILKNFKKVLFYRITSLNLFSFKADFLNEKLCFRELDFQQMNIYELYFCI